MRRVERLQLGLDLRRWGALCEAVVQGRGSPTKLSHRRQAIGPCRCMINPPATAGTTTSTRGPRAGTLHARLSEGLYPARLESIDELTDELSIGRRFPLLPAADITLAKRQAREHEEELEGPLPVLLR